MSGSEHYYDLETGQVELINDTAIPDDAVWEAVADQLPREYATLSRWMKSTRSPRNQGWMNRDKYVTPTHLFDQFRVAMEAAETDDTVSNVVETTEALAFNTVRVECDDPQEEDVWNQVLEDIDFDFRLREMWRELFCLSQFYVGVNWTRRDIPVTRRTEKGNKSRKVFENLVVPSGITVLDPLRVVPVGPSMFGEQSLAYVAGHAEGAAIENALADTNQVDIPVAGLITGRYEVDPSEMGLLSEICGDVDLQNLFLLNPKNVFRHTATKPGYSRFATCRMASVFELLDIKQQLRHKDRSFLLAGANYLLVVTKGSDKWPAKPREIESVAGQVRQVATLPILVSDHRLNVEIIMPDLSSILDKDKWETVDSRIAARLYQVMSGTNPGGTKDDSLKVARVVSRGLESRRDLIGKTLQKRLIMEMFNQNPQLKERPKLQFAPKRIALQFDPLFMKTIMDLRDRGDISRDTELDEVDLDQDDEYRKRIREKEEYDKVFTPTNVPHGGKLQQGTGGVNPGTDGRQQGGTKNGGGTNPEGTAPNPPKS